MNGFKLTMTTAMTTTTTSFSARQHREQHHGHGKRSLCTTPRRTSSLLYIVLLLSLLLTTTRIRAQQHDGQPHHREDPDEIHRFLQALRLAGAGIPRGGANGNNRGDARGTDDANGPLSTAGTVIIRPVYATLSKYGKIEGVRREGMDFFGNIPFSAPPVGNLRFAPPEPPTPWSPAILDGTAYGPDCWQTMDPLLNPAGTKTSEDCLTLNVFVPAGQVVRKRKTLLPVMVWFHGGAFQMGGANRVEYNGKSFVERGELIVVTVNYRLGALGFLVSSTDGLFGNYGLMDQRAGLDWISQNIHEFGGDPEQITLFGESAGAIMIGQHLMMRPTPFQRVIMQSNALGYTFRSLTVADFIGEAFKRSVDCRDLGCLRSERVEDLIKAQSSLMGVPRSVGDFFTWGPTLTSQKQVTMGVTGEGIGVAAPFRLNAHSQHHMFQNQPVQSPWAAVNVSQPLQNLDLIPDDIPILIGTNKHEGEMFIYTAFPAPMPKAVYWMFVGALFRDSAARILRHYRVYVDEVEQQAEELVKKQLEEEENKQFYFEHKEELEGGFEVLLAMNETRRAQRQRLKDEEGIQALVESWARGGAGGGGGFSWKNISGVITNRFHKSPEELREIMIQREERRAARLKARALREAAKVVVDFRPVMSRIIDDYLFRCPTWHYAHRVSRNRAHNEHEPNVYVYRFSQPTHVPGFKYCWGKSCHTAELPYVFHATDTIRTNYSTVGPVGQRDAPSAPEYPYTDMLDAFRGAIAYETATSSGDDDDDDKRNKSGKTDKAGKDGGAGVGGGSATGNSGGSWTNHTSAFQRIVDHFFGSYFRVDADDEIATDMLSRWAAFAKTGSPNHEDSQIIWRPWRNKDQLRDENDRPASAGNGVGDNDDTETVTGRFRQPIDSFADQYDWMFTVRDTDEDLSDDEDESDDGMNGNGSSRSSDGGGDRDGRRTAGSGKDTGRSGSRDGPGGRFSVWSEEKEDRAYRRRALSAVGFTLAEEDIFRTELKRANNGPPNPTDPTFLTQRFLAASQRLQDGGFSPQMKEQVLQIAQEIGVMGFGFVGNERYNQDWSLQQFLPELFELKWPPEGRLIERDCTCDLWDKIRCECWC